MAKHIWKFSMTGGVNQARIENVQDVLALPELDKKLWVALSCPVEGIELDPRTLGFMDTDQDGHIRPPEVIAAIEWIESSLKSPGLMIEGVSSIPLAAIRDDSDAGLSMLKAARNALSVLGKPDSPSISLQDIEAAEDILARSRFNGDGIVPSGTSDDEEVNRVLAEIISCTGGAPDKSGASGVSAAISSEFFQAAAAYEAWWGETEREGDILPYGLDSMDMYDAISAVRLKIDDYFTRCALAGFDVTAEGPLNPSTEDYLKMSNKDITPDDAGLALLPISKITPGRPLYLSSEINPAWAARMSEFSEKVILRAYGPCVSLNRTRWDVLKDEFNAHAGWRGRKTGAIVEQLGIGRVRDILGSGVRDRIDALIEADLSYEAEAASLLMLQKLVRYCRDLFVLINNFVSFRDFYSRKGPAIFQAGTLYLDGRSCELCIRVNNPDRHATLATMGRLCLVYCECTRKDERMHIAAALTAGDSDHITEGRNGVFYDRRGRDWRATVVKIVEHPISMRQAFWAPYKRVGKMIGEQVQKISAARSRSFEARAAESALAAGERAATNTAGAAVAPPPPFDVGKSAGIFAAIGLAVGALGTAIAAVVTGLFKLSWWQLPLAVGGLLLAVSGPSLLMAWFKLAQRNLAPLLDANGWAINSRVSINLPFGMTLTSSAKLPEGAERSLADPFAVKKSPLMPILLVLLTVAAAVVFVYFKFLR